MANDSIEFDIKVNGKDAKKGIEEVEQAQDNLEKSNTKMTNTIKTNWVVIGAAATAAMGAMMKQSVDLERATFGLTKQTKEYIKAASEQYGMSQDVIAGFVKTGKTAGMTGEEIKKMVDQAIALGRAYPHESTESFVDNLVQLNRTGEAQGYIVDILEQKYGLLDQKLLDTEQKMSAVDEATKGVNAEFDKTRAANIDKTFQEVKNMTIELGNALWDIADSTGALWAVEKGFLSIQLAANGYMKIVEYLKSSTVGGWLGADTEVASKNLSRIEKNIDNIMEKISGAADIRRPDALLTGAARLPTPDIEGKSKALTPFSPNITKDFLNQMVKENENVVKKVKSLGKSLNDDKQKQLDEMLAINQQFMDDYNATMMSGYEYELSQLDTQYEEYKKNVEDKSKVDEWYNEQKIRLLEEYDEQMKAYAAMGDALTSGLTQGLMDFAESGKLNFKSMANSIIQDMIRIQIQSSMMSLMGNFGSGGGGLLGGLFSGLFAKGAAFSNGNVTPFANGGVVNSPTVFPMANGMGLMGEAGAEAIMPLSRTSSGDLGVKATAPVVNVNVQNYGNDEVKVEQSGNDIQVIISQIASSISRGTGDVGKAIEGRYGLRKS